MNRRVLRMVCSLWLFAGSLLPGSGWALCVSPNGHVALEVAMPAPAAPAVEADCRDECPPERCEACRDVQIASPERTCPRRDTTAPDPSLAPANVALACAPALAMPVAERVLVEPRARLAPHLVHVLRI